MISKGHLTSTTTAPIDGWIISYRWSVAIVSLSHSVSEILWHDCLWRWTVLQIGYTAVTCKVKAQLWFSALQVMYANVNAKRTLHFSILLSWINSSIFVKIFELEQTVESCWNNLGSYSKLSLQRCESIENIWFTVSDVQ